MAVPLYCAHQTIDKYAVVAVILHHACRQGGLRRAVDCIVAISLFWEVVGANLRALLDFVLDVRAFFA